MISMKNIYTLLVFGIGIYLMYVLYERYLAILSVSMLICVSSFWLKSFLQKWIKYNLLASILSVLILFSLLFVPLFFVIYGVVDLILEIDINHFNSLIEIGKDKIKALSLAFPRINNIIMDNIDKISGSGILSYALSWSATIGKKSVDMTINTALILVFMLGFFYYGEKIYAYILDILPFDRNDADGIFVEVANVLRLVFVSSILNIIIQGAGFGIASGILGYDGVFYGLAYGICSLIPVVGGAIVWIPLALYELYLGHIGSAIFIAIFCSIFLATIVDNFLRPQLIAFINKILKSNIVVNEILILFAIIAGIGVFGIWGIIIGPAISTFFVALLKTYRKTKNQ